MGITGAQNGVDLVRGAEGFRIVDDGIAPPADAVASGRIGVSHAADQPWRWFVPGDPNVSQR
jgi:DNA-3-methyladenine glycosylase